MLIDADAKPIRNIPVYKRISDRKPVITALEALQSGARGPDPALYWFDANRDVWFLKEVHPQPALLRISASMMPPASAPPIRCEIAEAAFPAWEQFKRGDARVCTNAELLAKLQRAAQNAARQVCIYGIDCGAEPTKAVWPPLAGPQA